MTTFKTRTETAYVVVHCAQTHAGQDFDAAEVRKWHVEERGWIDIGYHFVIKRDGTVEEGRPMDAVGSHVKDWNHTSVGICLIGGSDVNGNEENNFTDAQWVALAELIASLLTKYTDATVQGHRDFPNVAKYCPSFNVKPWWAKARVAYGSV